MKEKHISLGHVNINCRIIQKKSVGRIRFLFTKTKKIINFLLDY